MYTYAWYHWLTFFYVYCFFGWIFESTYVSLKQRHFVNRGFLRLPMLPLYGTGAVMMLWVSLPVRNSLIAVYFSGVIGATVLEYITGWAMERLFKVRYWDYSNQKFNLHGYICLTSSIAWGFLTILMTEVIHPPIAKAVLEIKPHTECFFLITTTILFGYDTFQSTKEALDLARALESITKLRAELEDMQVQIALLRAETVQEIHRIKENFHFIADGFRIFCPCEEHEILFRRRRIQPLLRIFRPDNAVRHLRNDRCRRESWQRRNAQKACRQN